MFLFFRLVRIEKKSKKKKQICYVCLWNWYLKVHLNSNCFIKIVYICSGYCLSKKNISELCFIFVCFIKFPTKCIAALKATVQHCHTTNMQIESRLSLGDSITTSEINFHCSKQDNLSTSTAIAIIFVFLFWDCFE